MELAICFFFKDMVERPSTAVDGRSRVVFKRGRSLVAGISMSVATRDAIEKTPSLDYQS